MVNEFIKRIDVFETEETDGVKTKHLNIYFNFSDKVKVSGERYTPTNWCDRKKACTVRTNTTRGTQLTLSAPFSIRKRRSSYLSIRCDIISSLAALVELLQMDDITSTDSSQLFVNHSSMMFRSDPIAETNI